MEQPTQPARERVREAALELFATRGYHGTGIRQLAEHAGVGSATLYHYMGTKEDLLAAIMRECLEDLLDRAREVVARHDAPLERFDALVRLHVRTHALSPRETRVVDGEIDALGPEARRGIVALRDAYEALWAEAIGAAVALGDDPATGSAAAVAPDLARRALLEMCSGVARWYRVGGPTGLDELADRYAAMARGLLGAV